MAKSVFDFLHIKGRTEGSSNELSFDVLDAASQDLDNAQKRKRRGPGGGFGRSRGAHSAGGEVGKAAGEASGSGTDKAPGSGKDKKAGASADAPSGTSGGNLAGGSGGGAMGIGSAHGTRPFAAPAHSAGRSPSRKSASKLQAAATLSGTAEVQRRKKERRAQSLRFQIIAAIAVVAVLCAVAFLGYSQYRAKADFTTQLKGLVAEFIEIDPDIVKVVDLADDPLNPSEQQQRADALKTIPYLSSQLTGLRTRAEGLTQEVSSSEAHETLDEVVAAANARLHLLSAAAALFDLAAEENDYAAAADKAWARVLDADQLAREAAQMANTADTEQKTLASREKTQQAIDSLVQARAGLADLQDSKQKFDFAPQIAYLDARMQALEYALNTTDALLAGNRAAAQAANDKTNAAEQDAARMAAELPSAASEVVAAHYSEQLEQLEAAYSSARDEVTQADSHLRSKL